jgi:prophage tail gpP-like protein
MNDEIKVVLGDKEITSFKSYTITADLFQADDQFQIDIGDMFFEAKTGEKALVLVNGKRVLTGVIEKIEKRFSKGERTLTLAGRSVICFLIDNHLTKHTNLTGSLEALANTLLVDIRKIKHFGNQFKKIEFQKGLKRLIGNEQSLQAEPGESIFDVLNKASKARGLMLFDTADGTLVFGKPKELSSSGTPFVINVDPDTLKSNVKSGSCSIDISDLYTEIQVIGQVEGERTTPNVEHTATYNTPLVPYKKRMVHQRNDDEEGPKNTARLIHEQQMAGAVRLEYEVAGHTQDERIWEINEFCDVEDIALGVNGRFLIYSRTFTLSKDGGTTTQLTLGRPGVIQ